MKYLDNLLNLPIFPTVDATASCKRMTWLFSIVAVTTVTGFNIPFIGSLYLPMCAICLLYILSCGGCKINGLYVVMYLTFGLSAMQATEPFFNSKVRYLLFVCVTLLCTSCISSPTAIAFRSLLSRNLLVLLTILIIGSFFCFFLGINLVSQKGLGTMFDVTATGSFGGLFAHSMLLGPIAALVALMFLNLYLIHNKKVYIILFFMAAAAVVMSASRGATLALGVPIIYLLLFMKDTGKNRNSLIGLLVIVSLASVSVADRIAIGLIDKQQRNEEVGSTFNSRESKWGNRIQEFNDNQIFGIGFCAVDIANTEDYNFAGGVEPGSTHLSVLSMTGVAGFIPYVLILFGAYRCVRREGNIIAKMRISFLLAMITHATFEGYALYAGGFLCLVYWLVIGQCYDYKKIKANICWTK